jgi:hypothetical protein
MIEYFSPLHQLLVIILLRITCISNAIINGHFVQALFALVAADPDSKLIATFRIRQYAKMSSCHNNKLTQ